MRFEIILQVPVLDLVDVDIRLSFFPTGLVIGIKHIRLYAFYICKMLGIQRNNIGYKY